jgi:hypothetical protein
MVRKQGEPRDERGTTKAKGGSGKKKWEWRIRA